MKTAIVILNWNGRHLMEKFLPALTSSITESDRAEIIIADNASTDDSINWLKSNYPNLRVIENSVNEGFAQGYNSALSKINADYFLLLNSDVEVGKGWLAPLVNFLDENQSVAAVQPKLLWEKDKSLFEYGGASGGYIDKLGYPFCRGRIFGEIEKDNGQHNDPVPVFWASGACMLIRSSVFNQVGGFDPVFFAHMEEIDLCWRIRNEGHEIMVIPESVVYHVGGATLPKNNPGKTFLNFRNNLSMLYKNLPSNRVFSVIFLRLILDGVAGIKFLTEGHFRDFIAVIRAHWAFYSRILTGKLKRSQKTTNSKNTTIYQGSIVWDYYILSKKKFSDIDFNPEK